MFLTNWGKTGQDPSLAETVSTTRIKSQILADIFSPIGPSEWGRKGSMWLAPLLPLHFHPNTGSFFVSTSKNGKNSVQCMRE